MEPDLNRVADFLSDYGTVDVMLAVDPANGNSVGEVEDKVDTSDDIVRERLQTGEDLGILELSYAEAGDHGNTKRYYLTSLGRFVLVAIVSIGLDRKVRRYYDLGSEIEDLTEELSEWVSDEESQLIFENPSLSSEELREQLQLDNAYPGDNLPDNYEKFVIKEIESEGRKTWIGQIEDQMDYENL